MKRILQYLKSYKKECILAPFFKMLEVCFELLVPLVMASIIDYGIENGDTGYILRRVAVLVGLGILGLSATIVAQFFSARAATGFAKRVKSVLFAHIGRLSYADTDKIGTPRLLQAMGGDINQVQTGVNLVLRLALRSPFIVFGAMIMAFTVDLPSALIFVAAIPLLAVVVFAVMLWCIPLYRNVQQHLDKLLLRIRENLSGIRVLRAFCKQREECDKFTEQNNSLTAANIFVGRISTLMNPLTYIIVNLAVVAIIYSGGLRVQSGHLTQGEVVALYNYMSQILVELVKLANLIITVTKSLACADRISTVLDKAPTMAYGNGEAAGADVEFKNVSLRYDGAGDDTLQSITFTAPAGSSVGIIGGTGSGKTSLVNLIPRFYDATEGQVLIGGTDVRDLGEDCLRRSVAVVPQRAALFAGTIRDNLRFGSSATDDELLQAAAAAQATDIITAKGGLDAVIEQHGRNLSGGQRQRLTIARALVRRAGILILDDSASALDYATDAALREALRGLPQNPTLFIVSQRASSVRACDQIIVLDDGRVADIGTSDELLARCDIYREIYYTQYEKEGAQNG